MEQDSVGAFGKANHAYYVPIRPTPLPSLAVSDVTPALRIGYYPVARGRAFGVAYHSASPIPHRTGFPPSL